MLKAILDHRLTSAVLIALAIMGTTQVPSPQKPTVPTMPQPPPTISKPPPAFTPPSAAPPAPTPAPASPEPVTLPAPAPLTTANPHTIFAQDVARVVRGLPDAYRALASEVRAGKVTTGDGVRAALLTWGRPALLAHETAFPAGSLRDPAASADALEDVASVIEGK